ncbi:hypothetical protein ACRALDRAFT_209813 [Sodiomyces alcalophilus JCM 7366]|uniref:uncharacterized protein n=1 Tax=Sodiomyces alcalophilus JCM 7366 TaxID=591952 RepID=UPI0039B5B68B
MLYFSFPKGIVLTKGYQSLFSIGRDEGHNGPPSPSDAPFKVPPPHVMTIFYEYPEQLPKIADFLIYKYTPITEHASGQFV